jgi:hypothetical protein
MIDYILLPNTVGENPTGYHAQVVQTEQRTGDDFINTMMKLRGGLTRGEAEQILDLIRRAVIDESSMGNNIIIPGLCNLLPAIRGNFATPESAFDSTVNSIHLTVTASRALTKAIAGSPTRRVPAENSGMFIEHVRDVASNTIDNLLTPGYVLQLHGSKFKIAGPGATNGIAFLDADNDPIDVPPAAVSRNGDKQIDFVIPNLSPGVYHIRIITEYAGSSKLLAAPRTYIFPVDLTVA